MLNPQAVHLKIGSHLGKYRIQEEIGEGPISHVFLADDTVLYRQVALKVLKPEFAREPTDEVPEEEMSSAAVLLHSGIVPLYGTGSEGNYHYFSMALMPGGNLRQAMERGLSPHQALSVVGQIARALAFAHSKGINHQGIKPENILFRKDGSAVLSDFHVVKVHGFGVGVLTQDPQPHLHYVSPEQLQASGKQFGRGDLYSLGIVLYEMLTGQVPYPGENAPWQHIHSPVPKLPASLALYQELIDKTLTKRASDRFDINQLLRTVDRLCAGKTSSKAGNVTVLPVGAKGKTAAPSTKKGDRPFIEVAPRESDPPRPKGRKKQGAFSQEPAPEFNLSFETVEHSGIIPDLPLPHVSSAQSLPASPPPSVSPDRGSIGDFIPVAGKIPPKGGGKPSLAGMRRHQTLVATAVIAALAVGVLALWPSSEGDRPQSPSALSQHLRDATPEPSEEETARIWSAAEANLKEQFSRAVAYSRNDRREEAAAAFRKITEEFPQLPEPYNNLAVLYAAERDLDTSQRLLEEALRAHPSYGTVIDNLNTVQLEKALGSANGATTSPPRHQMLSELTRPFSDLAVRDARRELQKALTAHRPSGAPAPAASPPREESFPLSGEVSTLLTGWAKAWSERDVARYLMFYGEVFEPPKGKSRGAWEKERHSNITAPAWIDVSLSEFNVSRSGPGRLRVVVVQEYRSDRYRDRSLKAFELGREGNGWVILSEETLGQFR